LIITDKKDNTFRFYYSIFHNVKAMQPNPNVQAQACTSVHTNSVLRSPENTPVAETLLVVQEESKYIY